MALKKKHARLGGSFCITIHGRGPSPLASPRSNQSYNHGEISFPGAGVLPRGVGLCLPPPRRRRSLASSPSSSCWSPASPPCPLVFHSFAQHGGAIMYYNTQSPPLLHMARTHTHHLLTHTAQGVTNDHPPPLGVLPNEPMSHHKTCAHPTSSELMHS